MRGQTRVSGNPPLRYVCVTDVFIRVALNLTIRALYLQHFMSIEWKSHIELFRNGLVQEFYSLKVLIILEQLITSVVGKNNNNLNQQNFKVYWQIRIEYRGIMDRGSVKKKLKIK